MDKYVARTGKSLGCAGKKSVPTGLKKAATFLKDEYLKEIQSYDDQRYFFMRCKCYHSFRKNDPPHNVFLALCIVSGEVEDSKCSCVAGALGYCNHSLALMLKACKFSLYGSQNTKDLENEPDQSPDQPCTSKLQTWHQKGRGRHALSSLFGKLSTPSLLWMLLFPKPNSRILSGETKEHILSSTRSTEEQNFKQAVRHINPRMGLAQIVNLGSETQLKETRFGEAPIGSYASYQLKPHRVQL